MTFWLVLKRKGGMFDLEAEFQGKLVREAKSRREALELFVTV